jgi:hypothetical protein
MGNLEITVRRRALEYPHGNINRYRHGCRCLACRVGNAEYQRPRRAAHKLNEPDHTVSAELAQEHLASLFKKGIGPKAVEAESGVMKRVVTLIRTGRYRRIRESTERKILDVTEAARDSGTTVGGADTDWAIEDLLRQGFTMAELAAKLGYQEPEIHFYKRKRISLVNARRVERLYRMLERDRAATLPLLRPTKRGLWHQGRQERAEAA